MAMANPPRNSLQFVRHSLEALIGTRDIVRMKAVSGDFHGSRPVIARLRAHEAELHRAGVARLYLFGSVARQEARPDSDVDLFFDTDDPRFSLIELVVVWDRVSDIL